MMLEEKSLRLQSRLRRSRRTDSLRRIFRETRIHPDSLMAPIFVTDGENSVRAVDSMPGVDRYSVDRLSEYVTRLRKAGVRSILLFGIPAAKDERGTEAYSSTGVIPRAIRELREDFEDLVIAADVCLCEYTSHGHCGVLSNGDVDNDRTLPLLAKAAREYSVAGADIVAPSAMMDGQVRVIREALDSSGLNSTIIMGYSAKYASVFYGPFRSAADSKPAIGDRKTYQMDVANSREAMREIEEDIREGADVIMVKPALAYLDVLAKARAKFDLPIAAYNVSGEYSMIRAASMNGWLDEKIAVYEVLTSIKRAGADLIITYFAEQAARWAKEGW